MQKNNCVQLWLCLLIGLAAEQGFARQYDPLKKPANVSSKPIDVDVVDAERKRNIPVRIFLPKEKKPAPVVLFSHGLGGSRTNSNYLGEHWSARGYVSVFMQHIGSDESVWKGVPVLKRLGALKKATTIKNTTDRFQDVKSVLDQLEKWNQSKGHELFKRMDLKRVGMSGHSYGALTSQGVSGQSAPLIGQRYTDKRIDAAIMFSPNRPRGGDVEAAFGKVSIPWMLMTGTNDTSPINDTTVEDRRQVYPALPKSIDKYELVFHEGNHYAFSDGQQRRARNRNPNHHRVILALSTAFWDTHLMGNANAKKWLHGDEPKKVMEPKDLWQVNEGNSKKVLGQ